MEIETDAACLRADSNRADEIDLYDDLIAFCNLSPEEQRKESAPRLTITSEHESKTANQFFYADLAASNESILEPVMEQQDRDFELIEQSSFDLTDQPGLRPLEESPTYSIEDFPFELPDEPAFQKESETSSKPIETGEPPKKKSDYLDLDYLLRVTGPLAAFAATANAASSLLACKDCGSRASGEDMFCVTCGGLLDQPEPSEAAAVVLIKAACESCDSPVEDDEIFCPSCGAVLEGI